MPFASILLAAAIVPAGNSFTCTPVAVRDGDGRCGAQRVGTFA